MFCFSASLLDFDAVDIDQYFFKTPHDGWICNICNFTTKSTKQNMQRHILAIHINAKNFPCHLCEKTFSIENYRQKHYKNCHRLKLTLAQINSLHDTSSHPN